MTNEAGDINDKKVNEFKASYKIDAVFFGNHTYTSPVFGDIYLSSFF